tara:strand:- start:76 stop:1680 length:1605 start_codon:yes stop_codon:yes gene_type:complete
MAMIKFEVSMPDGSKYEVEAPEGTSEEVVQQEVERTYNKDTAPAINKTAEGARKFAQGLTFGFADEIEAKLQSVFSEKDYKEIRDGLRRKGEQYAKENPKAALALEIAGSFALPGFGAAKLAGQGVKGAIKYGTGQGALYGAGQAEELKDVAGNALSGGAIGGFGGGILNRAGAAIAPKAQQGAKKLLDEGVELTPGQIMGGGFNAFEESLSSTLPGIAGARRGATETWNQSVANKVLAPLGKKLPENVTDINTATLKIKNIVDDAYDDALIGAVVKRTGSWKQGLKNIVKEAEESGVSKRGVAAIKREINTINKMVSTKGISNKTIKKVDQNIKAKVDAYKKTTSVAETEAFESIKQIKNLFKNEIVTQNPKQGQKLLQIDKAYGNIKSYADAVAQGTLKGVFTPGQLLRTSGKGENAANTLWKKATLRTDLQKEAKNAQQIIGDTLPQSGTIPRAVGLLGAGGIASSALLSSPIIASLAAVPAVSMMMYSKTGQNLLRKYLTAGKTRQEISALAKQYASQVGTSGLLTTMDQ